MIKVNKKVFKTSFFQALSDVREFFPMTTLEWLIFCVFSCCLSFCFAIGSFLSCMLVQLGFEVFGVVDFFCFIFYCSLFLCFGFKFFHWLRKGLD